MQQPNHAWLLDGLIGEALCCHSKNRAPCACQSCDSLHSRLQVELQVKYCVLGRGLSILQGVAPSRQAEWVAPLALSFSIVGLKASVPYPTLHVLRVRR